MTFDEEQEFVAAAKFYVSNNLELNRLSDEDLEEEIENVVNSKLDGQYCTVEQRLSIVKQVYSSIRGLGLLDSIMTDDTITEVMINGKDNIFIEQNGRVKRLDKFFETDRRLEDIIQRIVGMAGREVNQANPIVDTRLQDGSRVNVVLPPIALCGPTVTIRKFSKEPMTIEKLIKYGSITEEIAHKLELLVRAKYNIFICGGTGSGKTSLVNLIPGFYPATEGEILLEGRDIKTMSDEELRGRIGVVPQKAVLFKGTIRSNLQWGKPDATEEEMWKALELAQASEVVEGKDGKLDATVAQNGKNFSGGQRQRLTIARALVREPEILILDDSASALDYATDAKLRAAIRTLEDKTTTFIVSQRASTIRHADKIIVLDDGEIAGVGTHDELLKDCTVYQEIYYSQYPEQRGGVR